MKTDKKIKVELTLAWTFDEKEWSDEKEHLEALHANPRIVCGYDIHHTWHRLCDMTSPDLKEITVTPC
mgnify:CR=1 FL=1